MTALQVAKQADGAELIRMRRPSDWDHAEWCGWNGCDNITPGGYRERNRYVWGYQEAGAATMIGWRGACSRAHALAIWRAELEPERYCRCGHLESAHRAGRCDARIGITCLCREFVETRSNMAVNA